MPKDELNFLEFLQSFRRGALLQEADARMSELLDAVHDTGGKGEMTIKLPLKLNKAGQIECVPEVKIAKPRRSLPTGLYFLTSDARLTRSDPNQDDWVDDLERRRARGDD